MTKWIPKIPLLPERHDKQYKTILTSQVSNWLLREDGTSLFWPEVFGNTLREFDFSNGYYSVQIYVVHNNDPETKPPWNSDNAIVYPDKNGFYKLTFVLIIKMEI